MENIFLDILLLESITIAIFPYRNQNLQARYIANIREKYSSKLIWITDLLMIWLSNDCPIRCSNCLRLSTYTFFINYVFGINFIINPFFVFETNFGVSINFVEDLQHPATMFNGYVSNINLFIDLFRENITEANLLSFQWKPF